MSAKNTRVLVVDDSALIREVLCDVINDAPGAEVVGTARDGQHALSIFQDLKPDVVTLDIEMPKMNGLETLEALLAIRPIPVIMVSSVTQIGADVTFKALEQGAMDYIAKPEGGVAGIQALQAELLRKIRTVSGADVNRILQIRRERAEKLRLRKLNPRKSRPVQSVSKDLDLSDKCIALGISTGGPPALTSMLEGLQPQMPPIVIVQHMPESFTKAFAWRLNSCSSLTVKEAATGDVLQPNHVYVAPGGKHLQLVRSGKAVKCRVRDGDNVSGHKPSVDVMMKSAAEIYGNRCLGVVMTGMGRDGSDGCQAIRAAGGYVLGQDEASSDVYGMNKVAFVEGHVDRQFSLEDSAEVLQRQVARMWGKTPVGV